MHKNFPMVKTTTGPKVGRPPERAPFFYVNRKQISTAPPSWGKGLWKNLWKMWKTQSFQQVFFSLPPPARPRSPGGPVCIISPKPGQRVMLRYRQREKSSCKKPGKKFLFWGKALSNFGAGPAAAGFFCEKHPKIFSGMFFRLRGILFLKNRLKRAGSQGGSPCRER